MRIIAVGLPILAIIIVLALVAGRPEPMKKEVVDRAPIVTVFELQTMTANFSVRSQGNVRPRTETVLSAELSGTVTRLSPKFEAGGMFAANEVLMRIDPTNYAVAVDQAEALVNRRQIEFDGASKLRSQGYRAESEYASAAAALASAKADMVRANRNLERTYIRLPYAGIVRSKDADIGQFVNPGTRLGVVFATNFAEVRLPLTDQDLAFVDLPEPAAAHSSEGLPGPAVTLSALQKGQQTEWQAHIVRTEGVVDELSRVTYAVARVDDPYSLHSDRPALPVGTFVAAKIEGSTAADIIRVPRHYVRGSGELIFVDEDNHLQIRAVNIIRADSNYVYIDGGAVAGEKIVVTALESPVNGMSVRISGADVGAGEAAMIAIEDGQN